jgi:antitoxin component of MazEF toxin-antitoxin module
VCRDTAVTLDTQQKLKQSLQQSDFKKVVVVPEAYIMHAQAPDGSKIVMEVSPDQMQAVIERVTAIEILVRLKDTHPDRFTDKQEQTLQRAVEDLYTREY